jgi:hypothetical protein
MGRGETWEEPWKMRGKWGRGEGKKMRGRREERDCREGMGAGGGVRRV